MRLIENLHELKDNDQTQKILTELLFNRHPNWVKLSSTYRLVQEPITLQEIHLSSWFAKNL